jgi:hypothetical protein
MTERKHTITAITPQSPLMAVVEFDGQLYYTSQYFHRQYLANSDLGKGKYQRHDNFRRMLRGIEAYRLYQEQGAIVEVPWESIKSKGTPLLSTLKPLFHAAGYADLILLNATAQAALSHHLDDELSKQVSVAINTHAARETSPPQVLTTAQMFLAQAQINVEFEQRATALEAQLQEQGLQIAALIDRQPPVGKVRIEDWLRRHSKPFLPKPVLVNLRATCRGLEEPEMFRPESYDYLCPYFSPYTIATAYDEVTRQLSFFIREASVAYRR